MSGSIAVTREIKAPATALWEVVSDLPEMGRWSGESRGGTWLGSATGPTIGAGFRGQNANGFRRWSTKAVVVAAEPNRCFAFDVSAFGIPIANWSYEIEVLGDRCRVTETWTDRRPGWFKPIGGLATGVADRRERAEAEMALTLDRMAAALED